MYHSHACYQKSILVNIHADDDLISLTAQVENTLIQQQ